MKNLTPNTAVRRLGAPLALASAIAMAISGAASAQNGNRDGRPFDRSFVASSNATAVVEARASAEGTIGEPVELMRTSFRVRPQFSDDLLISVNSECAALLNASDEESDDGEEDGEEAPENGEEESSDVTGASVSVWVEVDGEPVPVDANADIADDGSVVFCNANGTADFESLDSEEIVEQFGTLQATGGFSWSAEDIGRGEHELVVMAALDVHTDSESDEGEDTGDIEDPAEAQADAMAILGKRSLNVQLTNAQSAEASANVSIDIN